jgi:glycerate 2-kinase
VYLRSLLLSAFRAALERADPEQATFRVLQRDPLSSWIRSFPTVRLLGAGKAAAPMARAAERVLGERLAGGVVVVKDGHGLPLDRIEVLDSAHPTPDERSVAAGRRLLAEARALGPEALLLFLLSGGASSLIEAPAGGLSLEDLRRRNEELLRSGLPIEAINEERRRLSALKGGRLAAATRASLLTLILSDVPRGGPEVVGSGPTLASFPPTRPGHRALVVADHRDALEAAAAALEDRGVEVIEAHPGGLCDASARDHGEALRGVWKKRRGGRAALLWSGEATAEVRGRGRGGRNQELALAVAVALRGTRGVTVAVLATDGQDGPTDAAGAIVDGETARRIEAAGLDPARHLEESDAYPALEAAGALVKTGPTLTNVNDLLLVLVEPWATGGG